MLGIATDVKCDVVCHTY